MPNTGRCQIKFRNFCVKISHNYNVLKPFRVKFNDFSQFFEMILNESIVRVINTKDVTFFLLRVQLYAKCPRAHWEKISI